LKKIPRMNVSSAAYSAVKQTLLSSKYAPGDRVAIDELCTELEVSRTPVFEALNRLEVEGLVEIIPRKGVYLVSFTDEKAHELYAVRETLETMATKLAATNITDKQLEQLKKALDKQAASIKSEDNEGYATATVKFHNVIVEASGNKTLERLLSTVYSQMEALRLRSLYLYMPKPLRQSFAEHQRIYEAVAKRDPALCEREAKLHMETTTRVALDILADARDKRQRQKDAA
jgi:DNA-binding GntR family transcriptional regulator